MKYDPYRHHRRSIRLKGYDYAQPGAYFITICTHNRERSLGKIVDSQIIVSPAGEIVRKAWGTLQRQFPTIGLDVFAIMPNHIHGIITVTDGGGSGDERCGCKGSMGSGEGGSSKGLINQTLTDRPLTDRPLTLGPSTSPVSPPDLTPMDWIMMKNDALVLGKIVRYLKAKTTRMIHAQVSDTFRWQRNYYEHIIRSEEELGRIRDYIINNPARWTTDDHYNV